MSKEKYTRKAIKETFGNSNVLAVGYCNLQHLLYGLDAFGYSTRAEGWACDYYEIGNKCISTGYSPIGTPVAYKICAKYDNKAREIVESWGKYTQEQKYSMIKKIRDEFIKTIGGFTNDKLYNYQTNN